MGIEVDDRREPLFCCVDRRKQVKLEVPYNGDLQVILDLFLLNVLKGSPIANRAGAVGSVK
jgi:hypothetical protein